MPVWGSLDILEACGASDSGSNPDAGVYIFVEMSVNIFHKKISKNTIGFNQWMNGSFTLKKNTFPIPSYRDGFIIWFRKKNFDSTKYNNCENTDV
jgi:hypothetical protein